MESHSSKSTKRTDATTRSKPTTTLMAVSWVSCVWWLVCAPGFSSSVTAQAPDSASERIEERMRALQVEAEALAGESKTIIGELRRLEIERDLAAERLAQAEGRVAIARTELQAVAASVAMLEQQRVNSLPDLEARLVELYKHGRGSYARMLAGVGDLRELGRATRAVSSLVHLNERRIEEHRTRLEALRAERESVRQRTAALQAAHATAQKAREAADRAVAARAGLLAQIDRRRDLNARLAGELQVAQQRLERAVQTMGGTTSDEAVPVPMAPFRGVLDWPASGRVTRRFGQGDRTVGGGVKNGIEIAVVEQAPVQAVHSGTVGFAGVFPGYGTLVILDHGAEHYSLYGYLAAATVERGQRVRAGEELGRAGYAPAGGAALYFEVRIDGDPVDPVQWLKPR